MQESQTIVTLSQQFTMTSDDITDLFSQTASWEEKFRQLMLLGKKLPQLPNECQQEQYLVSGCESKVWLLHTWNDGRLQLAASSDAKIVKGLIAIVVAVFNNKTKDEISQFELTGYLQKLNLLNQLSPSRSNGLWAIIDEINDFCR